MLDRTRDGVIPFFGANIAIVGLKRLSREALRRLLEASSFAVVGDSETLAGALRNAAPGTRPDLVLHDFESDDDLEQALPVIREARIQYEGVKSVLLSDCTRAEVMASVIRLGVEALLSKDISADVLRRAVELVLLGQNLFPGSISQVLRESAAGPGSLPPVLPSHREVQQPLVSQRGVTLSAREHQILRCLIDGLSNKVIARELEITEATVKVHVKALLRKTQMANRTQAAVWALNNSWADRAGSAGAVDLMRTSLAEHGTPPEESRRENPPFMRSMAADRLVAMTSAGD